MRIESNEEAYTESLKLRNLVKENGDTYDEAFEIQKALNLVHEELMPFENKSINEVKTVALSNIALAPVLPSNKIHSSPPAIYKFPNDSAEFITECLRYDGMSAESIEAKIRSLATRSGNQLEADDYMTNRNTACALSIALNKKLRYPPYIRNLWKFRSENSGKLNADESIMSNDMKVIDLHWLSCNSQLSKFDTVDEDNAWVFDFSYASNFAAEHKKSETKATELGLAYTHMLSLRTLKSKSVFNRHPTIKKQLQRAPSLIKEELLKTSSRMPSSEKELLDVATATLLADGNIQIATQIYKQISGSLNSESVLRKRRDWILEKKIVSLSKSNCT